MRGEWPGSGEIKDIRTEGVINSGPPEKIRNDARNFFAAKRPEHRDMDADIEKKVKQVERQPMGKGKEQKEIEASFQNGEYRTVQAKEDMTLYRVYGGGAQKEGNTSKECVYLTPRLPRDRMEEKTDSALSNRWPGRPNTRERYAEVTVPKGTVMNIGRVAPQDTAGGQRLDGGGWQIVAYRKDVRYGEEKALGFAGNYHKFEEKAKKLEKGDNP